MMEKMRDALQHNQAMHFEITNEVTVRSYVSLPLYSLTLYSAQPYSVHVYSRVHTSIYIYIYIYNCLLYTSDAAADSLGV